MASWFQWGVSAFFTAVLPLASGSQANSEPVLRLRIYLDSSISPSIVQSGQAIAVKPLSDIGLRVEWEPCFGDRISPRCAAPSGPADFAVRFVPKHPAGSSVACGLAIRPGYITIYLDCVDKGAETFRVAQSVVLGHVLAHEVGHLLLPTDRHAPSGLMRKRHDKFDWQRAARGALRFSAEEVALMRVSLRPASAQDASFAVLVQAAVEEPAGSTRSLPRTFARLHTAFRTGDARPVIPAQEQLIALDIKGALVRVIDGTESHLELDAQLEALLNEPGAGIVLVHNHPKGNALSRDDLAQLAKVGVSTVVAIGNDGSVYAATLGAVASPTSIRQRLILAHAQLVRQLSVERPASELDVMALDLHMSHLLALVLHKAGAIQYQFAMSSDRRQLYDRWRPFFGRVTEASAGKVRAEIKRSNAR